MRPFAVIPILLSAAAVVLTFLCLFAGNDGFMDDYELFTLNISRIGASVADDVLSGDMSILPTELQNLLNSLPPDVQSTIESIASAAADSFATRIGLEDFYTAHILNYCYGQYTPSPVPSANVSQDDIKKDIKGCSPISSNFWFDPREILQESLDRANVTQVTVDQIFDQINWPDDINTGLDALRVAYQAMFACYVVAIILGFILFAISFIYLFTNGSRITACLTIIISLLLFVVSGAASGVATAVNVIGADAINENGAEVGVRADEGRKFLALTWAATAVTLLAVFYWFFDCCCGRSRKTKHVEYKGYDS